jgi:hypothetical protein
MAAFVIPSVIQKADDADPVKVANDLSSVRTGLEGFITDIGGQFPNQIRMLTNVPTTTNRFVDSVTTMSQVQVDLWNGPYLNATIGTNINDSLSTAFNANIRNHLQRYDGVNNKGEFTGGSVGATFNTSNTLFVALRIDGMTIQQARQVNKLLDGAADFDLPSTDPTNPRANVSGRFRYDKSDGIQRVTAYYMILPITK